MKRLNLILILVFGIIRGNASPQAEYPSELKQLHENVMSYIFEDQSDKTDIEKLVSDLKEDGTWPGIDYNYKEDGPWKPRIHLSNLLDIVKAYRTQGTKFYAKPEVSKKIHVALNYWLNNDFQSPFSWWYNEIGVPGTLSQILLLMEDELSVKQIDSGVRILNRAKIKYTGENKVWVSGIVLFKSLLKKDTDSINIASKSIQSELVVSSGDGIQPDWSFHQHGPQLQFGNYGLGFAGDMMKWIRILRKTPFAFDESKLEILRNYLLEGLQWASWKGKFDIPACGRQLLKNSTAEKADELSALFKKMARLDSAHAEQYYRAMDTGILEGHKYFWRSEYQVKCTPEYFFSVKMVSKRVKGTESSRFENVNGYHLGDGVTFLYQKGDEYEDIYPYWDWKKLPGTTALQDDKKLPLLLAKGYFTDNEFVGGVSDGKDGIAVMDFKRDGLTAKKSWFIFNNKIVCLGAGINASENVPVTTSVNQCYYRGDAIIKTDQGNYLSGEAAKISNVKWILHDKVGYFFPEKANLGLETKTVEGTWYNVSTQYPENEKIKSRIFNLWIDHGINPINESYSYVLIPKSSTAMMEEVEKNNPFRINNTPIMQEVITDDGTLAGIVFYKQGRSDVFGGILVNTPCIIMLKKEKGGINLSVSDPTQRLDKIRLEITGAYQSEHSELKNGQTVVDIPLPKGGDAGKTVSVFFKKL